LDGHDGSAIVPAMPVFGFEKRGQVTLYAMVGFGLLVLVVAASAMTRKSYVPTPYGYIEVDRWTGQLMACSVERPENWANNLQGRLISAGFSEKEVASYMLKEFKEVGAITADASRPIQTCVRSY
jgi:hypothetical protein